MLSIKGVYDKGRISLSKKIKFDKPVEIIVTFLDEDLENQKSQLSYKNFSFDKSQEILKEYKGNISNVVIEERRSYL